MVLTSDYTSFVVQKVRKNEYFKATHDRKKNMKKINSFRSSSLFSVFLFSSLIKIRVFFFFHLIFPQNNNKRKKKSTKKNKHCLNKTNYLLHFGLCSSSIHFFLCIVNENNEARQNSNPLSPNMP